MNNIIKTSSQEQFVKIVCETIKEKANKHIKEKGRFTFVLSGGLTPKIIFDELASNYKDSIEWSKVYFFWLDERCVEPNHKDSNYKLAYDHLISRLQSLGKVERIKGEINQSLAVKEYKERLLNFFEFNKVKFDFVLLGMGIDGHVASLFPNSAEIKKVKDLVLATKKTYDGYKRITLGLNLINMITFKMLLVRGKEKLRVLNLKDESLPINKISNKQVVYLE